MTLSAQAAEITKSVKFSDYTAGTQYAENEKHDLGDGLVIYTTQCHFTTQLRIYSSGTNNGYVISEALPGVIKSMSFNMGNKKDTLNVYGSSDGSSWTLVGGVATTTTSYADYSIDFPEGQSFTYFKLDVAGTNQIRIASMSITYETGGTVTPTLTAPTFSVANGTTFNEPFDLTISAEEGATIYYTLDGNNPTTESSVYSTPISISETTTVNAYAVKEGYKDSPIAKATYTYVDLSEAISYLKVTSLNQLEEGAEYLIACDTYAMGGISGSYFSKVDITGEDSNGIILITTEEYEKINPIILGINGDNYTFKTTLEQNYLYWSSGNSLNTSTEVSNNSSWTVTIESGNMTIANAGNSQRIMQYNNSATRFACYTGTQKNAVLYKKVSGEITLTPDVPTVEGVTNGGVYTSVPAITITAPEKNAEGILYSLSYTGANEESKTWEISEAVQSVELTSESLSGYGQFGTYALTAWAINGDEASDFVEISFEIVDNTCATIADFKEFAKAHDGLEAKLTGDVTVTNHSGAFLFVQDSTGALCIWGSYLSNKATPYQNGDVLSGDKIGTAEYSSSEPICMYEPASLPEATAGTAVEPLDMTDVISTDYFEEYENQYITLKNVTIDSANQKLVLADETPIPYNNTLSITMPEDETLIYNVIGIYYCVSGNLRIYPISFEALPILDAPTFSVNGETVTGGEFTDPFDLTISAAEGATIYYSLNSGEWTEYTNEITISAVTTIEAYAAQEGYNNSEIAKIKYTIPYKEVDGVLNFVEYFADESHWTAPEADCKWWTQGYQSRQVKFETNGAIVDFSSASHQVLTTSITDCPVIKAGTVIVSFTNTNSCFTSIDFQLKQWSDKNIEDKTPAVSYTLDGTEWVDIASTQVTTTRDAATGEIAAYAATDTYNITNVKVEEFPEGVKQVRLTLTNNDQVGLELINYKKYDIPTSVEGIEVDENAPVEYYNFQGVRVVNPEKGMYIRVQGGKATKVILN